MWKLIGIISRKHEMPFLDVFLTYIIPKLEHFNPSNWIRKRCDISFKMSLKPFWKTKFWWIVFAKQKNFSHYMSKNFNSNFSEFYEEYPKLSRWLIGTEKMWFIEIRIFPLLKDFLDFQNVVSSNPPLLIIF